MIPKLVENVIKHGDQRSVAIMIELLTKEYKAAIHIVDVIEQYDPTARDLLSEWKDRAGSLSAMIDRLKTKIV